jgi:hypothetical protein
MLEAQLEELAHIFIISLAQKKQPPKLFILYCYHIKPHISNLFDTKLRKRDNLNPWNRNESMNDINIGASFSSLNPQIPVWPKNS